MKGRLFVLTNVLTLAAILVVGCGPTDVEAIEFPTSVPEEWPTEAPSVTSTPEPEAQIGEAEGEPVEGWVGTIDIEQIEMISQSELEGQPVEGWTGTVYKLPRGNQFGQRFVRDDGEGYGIGASDEAIRRQIGEAAWTGAHIRVWGRLHTGVPAEQARQIEVDRCETLSAAAPEARDLSAFAEVSASSQLPSDSYGSYFACAAVDGSTETAWVEGVSGPGIGEWIQLTFSSPIELRDLRFDVGYDKSADLFAKNNRIKSATLVFSNGEPMTVGFEDARGPQEFAMARAPGSNVETAFVRVIIDEVYPGTRYDDTCLAEIEMWGVTK